jgi:L-ascorbate metabolism protein UlaG (beta-lactamase superfamily)
MNLYRIAHAGLMIEGGGVRCLMDPVLIDPFECAMNTFEPPVILDPARLGRACDVVVLSHEHGDHFCVESLAAIPRDRPIVFPADCALIEHALGRLGFFDRRPVRPGEVLRFRDLALRFTPSHVVFPELGVVFSAGGQCVWNCVDTELDDEAIARLEVLAELEEAEGELAGAAALLLAGAALAWGARSPTGGIPRGCSRCWRRRRAAWCRRRAATGTPASRG